MSQIIVQYTTTQASGEVTGTTNGAAIPLQGALTFSAQCSVTVDTPIAKTFTDTDVDVALDRVTVTAHGFSLGDKIRLTSTGTLPAGLATGTDYFIIVVDANTIKFASSLANALAGTAVDITGQGTVAATNTITPTALAGATVGLWKSNDATNWILDAAATAVTVSGLVGFEKTNPQWNYYRLQFVVTAGQMSVSSLIVVKGF